MGQNEKAKPLYLQALELRKQLLGKNHPDVADSLNNLALLYKFQGRYEKAKPLYLQVLELRKQLLGKNHPDVADYLNNLAVFYETQGKYNEAENLAQQAELPQLNNESYLMLLDLITTDSELLQNMRLFLQQ